jgi:hypothetical protein
MFYTISKKQNLAAVARRIGDRVAKIGRTQVVGLTAGLRAAVTG